VKAARGPVKQSTQVSQVDGAGQRGHGSERPVDVDREGVRLSVALLTLKIASAAAPAAAMNAVSPPHPRDVKRVAANPDRLSGIVGFGCSRRFGRALIQNSDGFK
jgi:hypothetical protein